MRISLPLRPQSHGRLRYVVQNRPMLRVPARFERSGVVFFFRSKLTLPGG